MIPKKEIFLSLLAGVIPSIITLGYKIFGPLIFLFSYFTALPFFLVSLKYNFSNLIISIMCSTIIISIFSSPLTAIIFFIMNIIPSILVSLEKRNMTKFSYGNIIAKITLMKSIIFLVIMILYSEKLSQFSLNFYDNLKSLTNNNLLIENQTISLIPSIFISSWIIILFLNLIIAKNIILKFEKKNIYSEKIINMIIPKWLNILFISLIIPITIIQIDFVWLKSLAIIISIPITIQGLVVINSIFKKMKMGNFLIYSFYGVIIFIPLSMAFITAIGVLENFYNFRKLKT